jgi:hypothetical protein
MPGVTNHSEKYIFDQVFSVSISLLGVSMRIESDMFAAEDHIL